MDFDLPELVDLSLKAFASLLVLFGLADTVVAWLLALTRGEFSGAYAANWILSHAAKMWVPLFFLAVLGKGIATLDVPAIGAFSLAATVGLVAYGISVLNSLRISITETTQAPSSP